jgi:heptosyltransferase-2
MTVSAAPAFERVYVRLPNWVGDVVMATPLLRALRDACPRARVVAGVRSFPARTLEGSPLLDETWILSRADETGRGLWRYAARLRAARFDAALLLTNSFGTALGPRLAGVPIRAGYGGEGRGWLLNRVVPRALRLAPQPMPAIYARVGAAAGVPVAERPPELPATAADRADAEARLVRLGVPPDRPLMALNPGAKFGASKLWAPERFAATGDELVRRYGAAVLVLVGPDERELGARVVAAAREKLYGTHDDVVPLTTLRALAARLSLLVTNDTGPRQFAVAAGVPVVCVMGSTHPGWTDFAREKQRVVRIDVPCGPCHLKTCPTDHRCMTEIAPADVLSAAADLLGAPV